MAAFTAKQASVTNSSKVVTINSGESIENINPRDFLVLNNQIVEITRGYISSDGQQCIELLKSWAYGPQNNQPCIAIPTTGNFAAAIQSLKDAQALVNENFATMQDWQTKQGTVTFNHPDGTQTTVQTLPEALSVTRKVATLEQMCEGNNNETLVTPFNFKKAFNHYKDLSGFSDVSFSGRHNDLEGRNHEGAHPAAAIDWSAYQITPQAIAEKVKEASPTADDIDWSKYNLTTEAIASAVKDEKQARIIEAVLIANNLSGNYGFFSKGHEITSHDDVMLDSTNTMWQYQGALPHAVSEGSTPDSNWVKAKFQVAWEDYSTTEEEVSAAGVRTKEYRGQVAGSGNVVLAHELGLYTGAPGLVQRAENALEIARNAKATLEFHRDIEFPSTVRTTGTVNIRVVEGCQVTFKDGGFEFNANVEESYVGITSIINSYLPGDPYLPGTVIAGLSAAKVTFSNENHGLVAGDYIKLARKELYPWIKLPAKIGEVGIVSYVLGNVVWLDRELQNLTYDKLFIYGDDECHVDLRLRNVDDSGAGGSLVYIRNYVRPTGEVVVSEGNYQTLVSAGNIEADLTLKSYNLRNINQSRTKFGYGLVDKNSVNSKYLIYCTRVRHGYTTTHGGLGTTPDCYGEAKDNVISGIGTFCITPFDTHASGESLIFSNCQSLHSLGAGFANRASNTMYENCHTVGNSDAGWQNFDGESASVLIGHNRKVTLRNCTSKGHKRGMKSLSNIQKDLASHRFTVVLDNVTFESKIYTEALMLRNTTCEYSNLTIVNKSSNGSVTESSWSDQNPIFLRAFVKLINSDFGGDNLTMQADSNALHVYPFNLEVDRSQNETARNQVTAAGLFLDNSKTQQFYSFGELFVSSKLHGKVPNQGPIDYTEGLKHNYLSVGGLMLHSKNAHELMRDDVQELFYTMSTQTKEGLYYVNTKAALTTSTVCRNAHNMALHSINTANSVDWANAERVVDLKSTDEPHIFVRCQPLTPNGETGVAAITITELKNPAGAEGAGQRIDIINDRPTGTVALTAINVYPANSAPKGRGLVASLIYNGAGSYTRII
ncbi:hypothetical protein [Pseudoalteromonas ostreae]|uniref:hypothetical protein n=1 Tax=Pseudoalteromonas ostreae TaxID=2774154 RepID=UPI001B378535|nr:hypothetical protein [Pseudoalteromonas ostreae]